MNLRLNKYLKSIPISIDQLTQKHLYMIGTTCGTLDFINIVSKNFSKEALLCDYYVIKFQKS